MTESPTSYVAAVEAAAAFLRDQTAVRPKVGIILGTGLGALADDIEVRDSIPYDAIPGFPVSTVETHAGRLLFGTLAGVDVVAMQGRFHLYEGYSPQQITFPVRVMKELGVGTLLVSNAAGGMNPLFRRGDLMLITDHINLQGVNPLIGPNVDAWGPRFPDMSDPYDRSLRALAEAVALEEGIKMQQGVYVVVTGPNLETRAEYRMLRQMGADVVGMSTVPEVIVARHMGLRCLAFSVITDECFPECLAPVELAEIVEAAGLAEPKMTAVMRGVVARIGQGA
ncbi:MAG: purine-nucleoside phosphorylase [Rhodothermales bacterium]|nr:purine-nucleoside phosphorylase [Rhodothermales bacterium]